MHIDFPNVTIIEVAGLQRMLDVVRSIAHDFSSMRPKRALLTTTL
jgi:hypothetical protein